MLIEAAAEQIKLLEKDEWKKELLYKAPPVLWFGNMLSDRPKVVTIGANPSRQEYLADTSKEAKQKIARDNNQDGLTYLCEPKNRFRYLKNGEILEDIVADNVLQDELVESYNQYFSRNPFGSWFGKSGKIEAFLNGLNASYYEKNVFNYRAIHTDMFPLATVSNFGKIKDITDRDIFSEGWAQGLLKRIISSIRPKFIIVFGKLNNETFKKLFNNELKTIVEGYFHCSNNSCGKHKFEVYKFLNNYNLVMVTTYIPNARGLTTDDLNRMGAELSAFLEDIKRKE